MSGTARVAAGRDGEASHAGGHRVRLAADPSLGVRQAEAPQGRGLGALMALAEGDERVFPLRDVRVRARIAGPLCVTVIEQRFENALAQPMEALYLFPLPARAAVTELWLRVGDRELKAECLEREAAEQAFVAARRAGHRAGLLLRERTDLHALRITNLPPGGEVTVRMVLLEELSQADGRWEWRFPTVIAPRFLPGTPQGHAGSGVLPDTDRVPDGSRLQPPLRLAGGTRLDLEVEILGPVRALASALHALAVELPGAPGAGLRVAPEASASLDRDFVLRWSLAEPDGAALRAWTDGRHSLALIEPPAGGEDRPLSRDAVFVLDRSGSMAGAKMAAAREAISVALHGLLPGDRFSLLAFDDRMERFAAGFVDYAQDTLEAADRWLEALDARGGTDMLPAIQAALAGETPAGRLRTVLFVTDGQVWNDAELLAAVGHRRGQARFFTLGIDTAVNGALLERLARVGGGSCELLTPGDDIEAAVARFEARFGSPLVDAIAIEGGLPADDLPLTLFAGRPVVALLEGAPGRLRVIGRAPDGACFEAEVEPQKVDWDLGRAWTRRRIAALEDQQALRPQDAEGLRGEILRLALSAGLSSSATAWVVVDRSLSVEGRSVERVQPVELPWGWDEGFRAPPQAGLALGQIGRLAAPPIAAEDDDPSAMRLFSPALGHKARPQREAHAAPRWSPRATTSGSRAPASEPAPATDPLADLARRQRADGSFGTGAEGDLRLTAAALLALVLAGNLRRSGLRRRSLVKAAAWLAARPGEPLAGLVLDLLARAEAGEPLDAIEALAEVGFRDLGANRSLTGSGAGG